ncbi:MAG: DUF2269 family protein [Clostridiales bacterium]|nr:DUF2269 family protein [Clostridiales bacterium]MCF8023263.1 DUF2269 family protein [Clostridiales bacterium]
MKKLGLKGQRWLKGIHIFLCSLWLGAGISITLLGFTKCYIPDGDMLYAVHECIKIIDYFVIIPASNAVLITGIIFSLLTNWGFFKYKWILVKWLFILGQILIGTCLLGPWQSKAMAVVREHGAQALQNDMYLYNIQMMNYVGLLQFILLVIVVFISVFKPWGKRKKVTNKTSKTESA